MMCTGLPRFPKDLVGPPAADHRGKAERHNHNQPDNHNCSRGVAGADLRRIPLAMPVVRLRAPDIHTPTETISLANGLD